MLDNQEDLGTVDHNNHKRQHGELVENDLEYSTVLMPMDGRQHHDSVPEQRKTTIDL